MNKVDLNFPGLPSPLPLEPTLAQCAMRGLAALFSASDLEAVRLIVQRKGEAESTISLPPEIVAILQAAMTEMAKGKPVTILPADSELSVSQACDLLGVSRQFLLDLLEKGEIPFRNFGPIRRVLYRDVMAFKEAWDKRAYQTLDDLAAEGQEMNPDY